MEGESHGIFGKMFLYLIHSLHLFYIKLFSQSETIFTNDEHTISRRLSLLLHYSIYLKIMLIKSLVYKNLNHKFPCSSSPYIQSKHTHVHEFCLVNILTLWK